MMFWNGLKIGSLQVATQRSALWLRVSCARKLSTMPTSIVEKDTSCYTTGEGNAFSDAELQHYEDKGYNVVKGLLPQEDIDRYIEHFMAISRGDAKPDRMLIMKDINVVKALKKQKKEGTTNSNPALTDVANLIEKIQDFNLDETFFDYCRHPRIIPYVKDIIGAAGGKSMHTMLINKPPDYGMGASVHPLHQDLWYFAFRPVNRIVACWTALQKITIDNGCLMVKEGSHKSGELFLHSYPESESVSAFYHGIQGCAIDESCVPVEMDAGDTIFFHPLLIHGSGPNKSEVTRRAISCHYAGNEVHYIDPTGTIQEPAAKEIMAKVSKQMPDAKEYNDLWRLKSRLVYGSVPYM
eukprot:CFRG7098T1